MQQEHHHWATSPDIVLTEDDTRYLYDIAHALNAEQPEHERLALG